MDTLSLSNPVFQAYIGHSSILLFKTLINGTLTAIERGRNNAFVNDEDHSGPKTESRLYTTPSVERIRRIHLNDMENIFPFILIAGMYVMVKPDPGTALLHFRLFTVSRLIHGAVYYFAIKQPARGLSCMSGYFVTLSMVFRVFSHGVL